MWGCFCRSQRVRCYLALEMGGCLWRRASLIALAGQAKRQPLLAKCKRCALPTWIFECAILELACLLTAGSVR